VAGEAVILDVASGRYFALDPVGTSIWQCLRKPCTIGSICEQLLAEYDVAPSRCESDVTALIGQLAGQGLVNLKQQAAG